jgi:hypothetical protein
MQTYTCPSCKFHLSETDKLWDSAIDSGRCPYCREPLRDFPNSVKLQEAKPVAPSAETLAAATSVEPSGAPSASRFCSRCGAPTQASARFCAKCGCVLDIAANPKTSSVTGENPLPSSIYLQSTMATAMTKWARIAYFLGSSRITVGPFPHSESTAAGTRRRF